MTMLHKPLHNLSKNIYNFKIFPVRNSALFINGARATENFVYVTPHVDFPEQFNQRHVIQEHLNRRKADIDLNKLESLWTVYEDLKRQKLEYDKKKEDKSKELGKIYKSDPNSDDVHKFKLQIGLIKDGIKKLKGPLWSAEEAAVIEALKIPNFLHPDTPDTNKVVYTYLEPPKNDTKDHLIIGTKLDLIQFKKNENYYFLGDAALFELGAKFYFSKMMKHSNYVQFSNPDFVKSVVVEGCGENHRHSDATFILHHNEETKVNADSRLHLTGGGSLCSFLAYHAKNVIYGKTLPLKYFSMGRQYTPAPSEEDSLFHVSQSSVVQVFGATKNSSDLDNLLNELIELLKASYSQLGYHFRLSVLPAQELFMWESLRLSVEMYSTSLKRYVEVGNISLCGDFISKRLMFTYADNKQSNFPHILSGTVLNVPKFLACVLEQDNEFNIPDSFKVENWAI